MTKLKTKLLALLTEKPLYPFFISSTLILQLVITNIPKNVNVWNGLILVLLTIATQAILFILTNIILHNKLLSGAYIGVFSLFFLSYYNIYLFVVKYFKQLSGKSFLIILAIAFISIIGILFLLRKAKIQKYIAMFLNIFTAMFLFLAIINLSFSYITNRNNPAILEQHLNEPTDLAKLDVSNTNKPNIYYFIFDTALDTKTANKYFDTNTVDAEKVLASENFKLYHAAAYQGLSLTIAAISNLFNPTEYDNNLKQYMKKYSAEAYTSSDYVGIQTRYYDAYAQQFADLYNNPEFANVMKASGYTTLRITMSHPQQVEPFDISYSYSVLDPFFNDIYSIFYTATPINIIYRKITGHSATRESKYGDATDKNLQDIYRGYTQQPLVFQKCIQKTYNITSPKFIYAHILLPHYPFVFQKDGTWKITPDSFSVQNYKSQYEYSMNYMSQLMADVIAHDPTAMIVIQGDHGLTENYLNMDAMQFTPEEHEEVATNVFLAIRQSSKLPMDIPDNVCALDIPRYIMNNVSESDYPYITANK
jgi:hypothetical protein